MKNLLLIVLLFIGPYSFSQVPAYLPTNGLVGWWPFNGNSNDESGSGNNGTVNGATLGADRNLNPNAAYLFDGLDDNIQIPHSSSFDFVNGYTVSMWVRMDGEGLNTNNFYTLISKNNTSFLEDDVFHIMISSPLYNQTQAAQYDTYCGIANWNSDDLYVAYGKSLWNYSSTGFYATNLWWHVVLTYYPPVNDLILYVNGQQIPSTWNSAPGMPFNNIADIFLGVWPAYNNNFYGAIDDVAIWNRELLPCELEELFTEQMIDSTVSVSGNTLTSNENSASSYQWLDCDNGFATIPGETNQSYTPVNSGNYAVTAALTPFCADTSDCFYVNAAGLNDLPETEKKIVNVVDIMGRETENKPNTLLIYIYSDGTTEKVLRIE